MSTSRVLKRVLLTVAGLALVALVALFTVAMPYARALPPRQPLLHGFHLVGYHDLGGRPGFKMAMQVVDNRWYLYVAHMWQPGWTILDVTDPAQPAAIAFIEGPPNTMTLQIQVADGRMVTGHEKPLTDLIADIPWQGKAWILWDAITTLKYAPWRTSREGIWIWDVADPEHPRRIGEWATGASGTHRNFYDGGRYVHLAATMPRFRGHIYVILDIRDPARPVEASRWFLPEQDLASGIRPVREGYYLHGPVHVEGDRAYLPYGIGGMVILDVADVRKPVLVGRLELPADLGSSIGVHTVVPMVSRGLAVINSEPLGERCRGDAGRNYAAIVDIADETTPRIVSFLPEPEPPPGAAFASFCDRGGRFGTHNQHHPQHQPHLFTSETRVFMTYFNAGVRLYDIADAAHPREVAYFVPPDPVRRLGILPTELVAQTEDVLVDARGYAFVTDKNQGVYVVRADGS
jgi:hypothetical protein